MRKGKHVGKKPETKNVGGLNRGEKKGNSHLGKPSMGGESTPLKERLMTPKKITSKGTHDQLTPNRKDNLNVTEEASSSQKGEGGARVDQTKGGSKPDNAPPKTRWNG